MSARSPLSVVLTLVVAAWACGQTAATGPSDATTCAWRPTGSTPSPTAKQPVAQIDSSGKSATSVARVTNGSGTLPNEHGQVWREYNISPYTVRVTATKRPEQAIVDWILQETGYEAWHSEPLGVLSATRRTLRVYHTAEMQAVVAGLVDRFVASEAETCTFALRVVTIDHPNWRAVAQRLLRPVPVQTPGIVAWLVQKEDAALLLAELRRRNDYREHSSPHLMVNNGQSTMISAVRGRSFVRDVVPRGDVWPGFEVTTGQVDEGFSLEFSPLLSADRQMIDAVIKCNIDQVERMVPVMLDVPTTVAPRQRTKIEVPQMTHFRFHERFRWPVDQVLLVGMGMIALPVPVDGQPLVAGLPLPIGKSPPRADLLVFVESKGKIGQPPRVTRTPRREAKTYRGRY